MLIRKVALNNVLSSLIGAHEFSSAFLPGALGLPQRQRQ